MNKINIISIDEAIAHERKLALSDEPVWTSTAEHLQIATWLEEFKLAKSEFERGRKQGYLQALEDMLDTECDTLQPECNSYSTCNKCKLYNIYKKAKQWRSNINGK